MPPCVAELFTWDARSQFALTSLRSNVIFARLAKDEEALGQHHYALNSAT